MTKSKPQTAAQLLQEKLVEGDQLSVSAEGDLLIEGHSVKTLVEEYGAPLHVLSETTLRNNYRRIKKAFSSAWPADVNAMYAIKANTSLAIRMIMTQEGAGGDCFGLGELEASVGGGADMEKVTLNGSFKGDAELKRAIELGMLINIDAQEEIRPVIEMSKQVGKPARVALRLKIIAEKYFSSFTSDAFAEVTDFCELLRRKKWGVTETQAITIINDLKNVADVELCGYHTHLGRHSNSPDMFTSLYAEFAQAIVSLYKHTGYWPTIVNLGGGWPRQREPELKNCGMNPHPIEYYADAVAGVVLEKFSELSQPTPELWLEPGRYITGNAGHYIARIGLLKHDREMNYHWVNIDASTFHLPLIEIGWASHYVTAATRMNQPITHRADIVGTICVPAQFAAACPLPDMEKGDLVAVLDSGLYGEAMASQFNSIPRPATVLVSSDSVDVIRRRETLDDVFATQVVPGRLTGCVERKYASG